MSTRDQLKALLASGNTAAVTEALWSLAKKNRDDELENRVVIQSGRLEELSTRETAGLLSFEEARLTRARITHALLSLVDQLDDEGNFRKKDEPVETHRNVVRPKSRNHLWTLLAGAAIIAVAGFIFISGLADPVSVTVFVHGKNGVHDMILRQQGHVLMDVEGGERKKRAISENGEAYFQNLSVGQEVRLNVDFSEPYRALHPDSIYVVPENGSIYLEVGLQNLDKVFGTVIGGEAPLSGVVVSIGKLRDTTDGGGFYEIFIPDTLRKKEQEVSFSKEGYRFLRKKSFPQTGQSLDVVMDEK